MTGNGLDTGAAATYRLPPHLDTPPTGKNIQNMSITEACVLLHIKNGVLHPQSRLDRELKAVPKLKKYWSAIQKRDKKMDEDAKTR